MTKKLDRVLILLLSTFASTVLAQTTGSGTISGNVTDPRGAMIPGANVTIHNTGTGIEKVVPTNDVGLYSAPFIQPGSYQVTVTKQGFARVVRKDLSLQVGQTLTYEKASLPGGTPADVRITARAAKEGNVRIRAELTADVLKAGPLKKEASATIIGQAP